MVQFNPPPGFRADPTVLVVGEDGRGRWEVHENHGRVDAVFARRDDAIRFAKAAKARLPGAFLMIAPEPAVSARELA